MDYENKFLYLFSPENKQLKMSRIIMLINLKWHTLYLPIIIATFVGCSGNQKQANTTLQKSSSQTNLKASQDDSHSKTSDVNKFSEQQLNYEIKKLNSEINYLKEQVNALDVKSSLYADPFDIYNKEIVLNNGSSIFCKILSQDNDEIFVETLIGNLTLNRSNVVRIVENVTVLEDNTMNTGVIEINLDDEQEILDDADLLSQRQAQSSASVILIGDISESRDKSGNTILTGELKNIGTERADLVRIDFTLRKNFQGDIERVTAYAIGSSHVFQETGIISNSSIKPGALRQFKLIIPNNIGNFICYSYDLYWEHYE